MNLRFLYHTKFDIDYDIFLQEYEKLKFSEKEYEGPKWKPNDPNKSFDHWRVIRQKDMTSEIVLGFADKIQRQLSLHGKVSGRFYRLLANRYLTPHHDAGTKCCINFILNDNAAAITSGNKSYTYKQALINTTKTHSVENTDTDRIILKISIFDVDFDEVQLIMDHYGFLEE